MSPAAAILFGFRPARGGLFYVLIAIIFLFAIRRLAIFENYSQILLQMFDFLRVLIRFFEENHIPYMLSGSMAMSAYTLPRFTRDFDFVVHLKPENALLITSQFKEGYYCDEDSVKEAIHKKSMFNIIDHKSNYKADFVILKNEPYRQVEFDRRQQFDFLGMKLYIVSPEDLLLSKLIWIQELQSSLQMDDIKLLAEKEGLDLDYIYQWIDTLKLNTFGLINDRHS